MCICTCVCVLVYVCGLEAVDRQADRHTRPAWGRGGGNKVVYMFGGGVGCSVVWCYNCWCCSGVLWGWGGDGGSSVLWGGVCVWCARPLRMCCMSVCRYCRLREPLPRQGAVIFLLSPSPFLPRDFLLWVCRRGSPIIGFPPLHQRLFSSVSLAFTIIHNVE